MKGKSNKFKTVVEKFINKEEILYYHEKKNDYI